MIYAIVFTEKDDIKQQLTAALEASEHAMEVHSMLNEKLDLVMRYFSNYLQLYFSFVNLKYIGKEILQDSKCRS